MYAIGKYFIAACIILYFSCFSIIIVSAQDRINQAQLPVDTTYASQFVGVAESLIKIGRVDSALQYMEDAAAIYTNAKAWKACAQAYNQIGFELLRIRKYEEAYQLFNNAFQITEKNLQFPNPTLATTCNHLGAIQAIKGNYSQALKLHNKALDIQQAVNSNNKDAFVKTYLNIGSVYYYIGDYQNSLEYNLLAFELQKTSNNASQAELAETYNNLGLLHLRSNEYQKALEYYLKALETKQQIYFASHPKIATTYTDIALSYQKLEEFDKALSASDNALVILSNTFEENHPDFGVNYQLRGDIHFEQADYKEAIDFYKKALDNRLSANILGGTEIAETYLRIAKTYEGQKYNPMGILPYVQKAIQALVYQFNEDDIFETPSLDNVLSEEFLLDAINYKALMFRNLYNETGNKNHLDAALKNYQLAAQIVLKSTSQHKIDNRKPITAEIAKAVFENGANIAYQLAQIHVPTERVQYIDAGFQLSEQYKKYQQLIVLKSGKIPQFKGIDAAKLSQEKQLKIDVDFYHKLLLEEYQKGELISNNTVSYLQNKLEQAQNSYRQLLEEYRNEYPAYFQMKFEQMNTNSQKVQSYLQDFLPQTATVSYFMGDSLAYSYTLTKDTSFVKEFLIDISLKNNIQELVGALSNYELLTKNPTESYQQYTTNAYAIFQSVLRRAFSPIENKAENLILIRDGMLGAVPFEALLKGVDSRQTPFSELQYLVKTHSLSYAFSASDFLKDMRRKSSNRKAILGMSMDYNLVELNVEQAANLQHDWQNSAHLLSNIHSLEDYHIYSNKEATKSHFLQIAEKYRTAQLTNLGFLNPDSPLQSTIWFSSAEGEDSYIAMLPSELYNEKIPLDLLILNRLIASPADLEQKGLNAWQQALSYAGCLSTLTTTWENNPEKSAILMGYFYENLQEGLHKIEALSKAKRTFIEKYPDEAHPHYWSSPILLGNSQNIDYPNTAPDWTLWAIAGGGILLLLIGIWMGGRFFKSRQASSPTSNITQKELSSTFILNK